MFEAKKQWIWRIPLFVIAICVLAAFAYNMKLNSKAEPKVVYTMPERTGATKVNTGGISFRTYHVPSANTATPTSTISESLQEESEITSDFLVDEECCPEESLVDTSSGLSFDEQYMAWKLAMEDYTAKLQANADASLEQDHKILSTIITYLSFATPEERGQIDEMTRDLEPELRAYFDNIPSRPPAGMTPQQVLAELQVMLTANTDIYNESELTQEF